jgi:hypothetical protein
MLKKILTFSALVISLNLTFAQAIIYTEAPLYDGGLTTGRAPNGTSAHAYMRASTLVLASELTSIAPGTTLTTFGFTVNTGAASVAPVGNFTVYLQNTPDIAYSKGTTFATAIIGMTSVYSSTVSIPISVSTTSYVVNLSTPFVYTGGGIYVAYDWYCPGPYSSVAAVYRANSTGLIGGLVSAATPSSGVAPPATLATSSFRPNFIFGATNTYTNEIEVMGVEAPGKIASTFNTPHLIKARIRNNSAITKTSIPVSLNVTGANTFTNNIIISSLSAGASTLVTFSSFNPLINGINTLSVSVTADEKNTNNSATYSQSVTCSESAINPALANYTLGAIGFNTSGGIIAVNYANPVTSELKSIRVGVSTNTASVGNPVYAVLLDATGTILATTNTLTISSPNLGTFQTLNFATNQSLTASTNYYLGFAQTTNSVVGYFPIGAYNTTYVAYSNYGTTALTGGLIAPLTSNLGYFAIEGVFETKLNLTVNSGTICAGNSFTMLPSGASTYTFSGGSAIVTPTATSGYSITGTNSNGCVGANSAISNITVNPAPVIIVSSGAVCIGGSWTITPTGASTYTYSGGSSVVSPLTNTSYTVTGTSAAGCLGLSGAVSSVTVNANPVVTVNSGAICSGASFTMVPAGASTYVYSGGSAIVSPAVNTSYTVTGTNAAGCTNTAASTVTVNALPILTATSGSICSGNSFTMVPTGAITYTYSGGSAVISPSVTTSYTVSGSNAAGCVSSIVKTITVSATPVIIVSPGAVCIGGSWTITPTGATTYTYSSGSAVVSPTATTSYTVSGSSAAGCQSSTVITVSVNPTLAFSANSGSVCIGSTFTMTPSGASSYTFSSGTAVVTPTTTTTYTIVGVNSVGCYGTQICTVTVNALPLVSATTSNTLICLGGSAVLTASTTATSYTWNTGATTLSVSVSPTITSTYTVNVSNAASCSASSMVMITVSPCTGINEIFSNSISVYPNPNNGLINISLTSELAQHSSLEIYDAIGKLVVKQVLANELNAINISNLNNGIYLFKLLNNSDIIKIGKLIKE